MLPEMKKLAEGREDELHHGILTASGADEGRGGTLAGTIALRNHDLSAPRTFNFRREKSNDHKMKKKKTLKALHA